MNNSGKFRIGIDVGGTFTDAVLINNDTYELVDSIKIPTTHNEGVAAGIIRILQQLLKKHDINPEDIIFIAHGTTQATNALLEGDVARVGVIGIGGGAEAVKVKNDTNVGTITLAVGKDLKINHKFINSRDLSPEIAQKTARTLKEEGAQVVVVSAAYSVENPAEELSAMEGVRKEGMMVTCGHEISQLFGLKVRTRTAVINGSLIPRMMETADMTERAIRDAGIRSQLMIMRCDGGVMSIAEVRRRPILTMLSGLAAGVAGALMYEKISDGLFFEAGGTSTDISVIKDGKVMVSNAQVGGHKTYLRSLDIRTLGVAGGSMIIVDGGRITDIGPRSAHIAGLAYECFATPGYIQSPEVNFISPLPGDLPNHAVVSDGDIKYALTLAGAANLLGYVPEGDYARGDSDNTLAAWTALGDHLGITAHQAARQAMDLAADKVMKIAGELTTQYELDKGFTTLVGGGGSASVIVPYLAQRENYSWRIAQNAPSISAIGVALAMIREELERTVINATEQDIERIRHEVIERTIGSGASPETVEVTVEMDIQKNILRAVAIGSTELRNKDLTVRQASPESMRITAAKAMDCPVDKAVLWAEVGRWSAFQNLQETRRFFGLIKSTKQVCCVLDREGIARLKKRDGQLVLFEKNQADTVLRRAIDQNTEFSEANAILPGCFIFWGERMLDLSGLGSVDHLYTMLRLETKNLGLEEKLLAVLF